MFGIGLAFPTLVGVLGGLTPGLSFGFSSACTLQIYFTVAWAAFFASCLNLGGFVGGILSAPILSRSGRRAGLLCSCIPGIFGWFSLYFCADSVYQSSFPTYIFMIGRILTGVSAGLAIPSSASYLLEIAPPGKRGLFGTLTQVGIVVGIAINFFMAIYLVWEHLALINGLFTCVVLILAWMIPESPKWLKKTGRIQEAESASAKLYGLNFSYTVESLEAEDLSSIPEDNSNNRIWSYIWPYSEFPLVHRPRLMIAVTLMCMQQLTGINAILYFAESVCLIADSSSPPVCAFYIGLFQMIFTIMALFFVNQFPRKRVLSTSSCIMALSHFAYAITVANSSNSSALNQFWINLFMMGFSFGWGPLPILVTMEMFPVNLRGSAVSAAVAVSWIAGFVVTELFELLNFVINPSFLFASFGLFCVLSVGYVQRFVPETS